MLLLFTSSSSTVNRSVYDASSYTVASSKDVLHGTHATDFPPLCLKSQIIWPTHTPPTPQYGLDCRRSAVFIVRECHKIQITKCTTVCSLLSTCYAISPKKIIRTTLQLFTFCVAAIRLCVLQTAVASLQSPDCDIE